MSLSSRMRTWARGVFRQKEVDAQVNEELRFHIESYADDLMRSGMPHAEAERRARAELGSVAAARRMRARPGERAASTNYAATSAMLCAPWPGAPDSRPLPWVRLALGIGANTVIFTTAQHALLDRLPCRTLSNCGCCGIQITMTWLTASGAISDETPDG